MDFVSQVVEFNQEILGIEQRDPAPLNSPEFDLTVKCLTEEIEELVDARISCDYIAQIDAVVDLLYFGVGSLYKMGLSPERIRRICTAVHESNMTKRKGVNARRDTGAADATKPVDWVPPEVKIANIVFPQ